MKRLLVPLFVVLFVLIGNWFAPAIELGEKMPVKTSERGTERAKFWHQFYLGLEENKKGGLNLNERANRTFLEKIKKILKSPKIPWYNIEFARDSASAPNLMILSITRFPNGNLKGVAAKYIQKNPRYEFRTSLSRGKRLGNYWAAHNIAEEISVLLPDIKRDIEYRAIKSIIDSALAKRKGDTLLPGMGRITGQVLDSTTNKPLHSVEILLFFRNIGYSKLGARTDERGFFDILNVPPVVWDVRISYHCSQPTFSISVKENETVSMGAVKLNTMSPGNGRITGQVLDSTTNEPLKGARVVLFCPNGISAKLGAITDEKGNFEVVKVPLGMFEIAISYGPIHRRELIKNVGIEENQTISIGVVKLVKGRIEEDTICIDRPHH